MPYWVTISLEDMRYPKEHAHSKKKASRRLLGALSTEARRQIGDLSLSNLPRRLSFRRTVIPSQNCEVSFYVSCFKP
jgi:hypothetical protein